MSFFDNIKIAGWAFFIIGILMIVSALVQIVDGFGQTENISDNIGFVIAGIGALIAAVIYFLFGNKVRNGTISEKIDVLGNYVRIVGVTTAIIYLFKAVGGILNEDAFWANLVWVVLGLIIAWIGGKINDGKTTDFDKILWIVLLIIFVVLFIGSLLDIGGAEVLGIISAICYAIVYLFMIVFMLDEDVRKKMGI